MMYLDLIKNRKQPPPKVVVKNDSCSSWNSNGSSGNFVLDLGSAWHVNDLWYQDILQTITDRWKLWFTQHYYLCTKSKLLQVQNNSSLAQTDGKKSSVHKLLRNKENTCLCSLCKRFGF